MKPSETKDLIRRLQAGDLEALGQLYDLHKRLVYRTALGITGDPEAAADLLQETFLRLHRFSRHLDTERPLEPWLYRVTTNLAYTWVKRQKRWLQPLEEIADWLMGDGHERPSYMVELDEEWEQVQRAMTSLPLPQRTVVVLYYLNDLSLKEIAEVLDVPIGTVKSRLHYGRKSLKRALGLRGESLGEVRYEVT